MKTKIYVLTEPDGMIRYIGKTSQTLSCRLSDHLYQAKHGEKRYSSTWIRSLFKKGYFPNIQLIGEVEGNGVKEEIAWIKYLREEGMSLTNLTDGGEGTVGYKHTEETIKKLKLVNINHEFSKETRRKISEAGRKRVVSDKTKKKLSESKMGHKLSKENKLKLLKANLGKHPSEKTRRKMSESRSGINNCWYGKCLSEEHKHKISESHKGIHPSEETKKKMSNQHKGRPISEETRMKRIGHTRGSYRRD